MMIIEHESDPKWPFMTFEVKYIFYNFKHKSDLIFTINKCAIRYPCLQGLHKNSDWNPIHTKYKFHLCTFEWSGRAFCASINKYM